MTRSSTNASTSAVEALAHTDAAQLTEATVAALREARGGDRVPDIERQHRREGVEQRARRGVRAEVAAEDARAGAVAASIDAREIARLSRPNEGASGHGRSGQITAEAMRLVPRQHDVRPARTSCGGPSATCRNNSPSVT